MSTQTIPFSEPTDGLVVPSSPLTDAGIKDRVAALDWPALEDELWARGFAATAPILTAAECESLVAMYGDTTRFRSRIEMARHRFGEGDYQYFANPLPALVHDLRQAFYPRLARVANGWSEALGMDQRYPPSLTTFLAQCAEHGQTKPTPLLLHYEVGGYNALHQDLYGDVAFPMQVVMFLSRPAIDYEGGEFLVVEQRPRAQSVGEAIAGGQGTALIFTTRTRPVRGGRGYYRANVRHGVSRVRRGRRYTLGIIFHDAR
jgi:hypothetical protein